MHKIHLVNLNQCVLCHRVNFIDRFELKEDLPTYSNKGLSNEYSFALGQPSKSFPIICISTQKGTFRLFNSVPYMYQKFTSSFLYVNPRIFDRSMEALIIPNLAHFPAF